MSIVRLHTCSGTKPPDDSPLSRACARVTDFADAGIMVDRLISEACRLKVLGLAAPQLGVMLRVFVVGDPGQPSSFIPFINPMVVSTSDNDVTYEEKCASFPGLFLDVSRKASCRVRYADRTGEVGTGLFNGLTARVILHEMDHLDGVVFTKRVDRTRLTLAQGRRPTLLRRKARNDARAGKSAR